MESKWFTRGWTLQELLAPRSVEFFSSDGLRLGDKSSLERQIHQITKIPVQALRGGPLSEFSVEDRMSWAENRQTKRGEDQAYCLLGIFDIEMSPRYGAGREKELERLLKKVRKHFSNVDWMPLSSPWPARGKPLLRYSQGFLR